MIMKSNIAGLYLAAIAASATLALASSEIKVIVYDGPTKCSNGAADDTPTKVEADYIVGFHFTVTVDESSVGSRETVGRKIESSRDAGIAPSFPVGQGKVVAGLDQGIIGLCKGSSAHIIVPPHLAYGRMGKPEQGVGSDATLRYDVEIVDIQPPVPNDFKKIDGNKDWKISRGEARKYFEGKGQALDYDSLWESEDNDGDGYISWEEFSGPKGSEGPPPKQKQQQKPQQTESGKIDEIRALFERADANNDGKLSKEELGNMFIALGNEMTEEFWSESDPDGDGYVLFEEFMGSTEQKQQQKQQQQKPQQTESGKVDEIRAMFERVDADKDGKLSKEELGNMFTALGAEMTEEFWSESDPDGDGYVLFEEFMGSNEGPGSGSEL